MNIKEELAEDMHILRCSGLMGHEFTVTGRAADGSRRKIGETDSMAFAVDLAERDYDTEPRIYHRRGKDWARCVLVS